MQGVIVNGDATFSRLILDSCDGHLLLHVEGEIAAAVCALLASCVTVALTFPGLSMMEDHLSQLVADQHHQHHRYDEHGAWMYGHIQSHAFELLVFVFLVGVLSHQRLNHWLRRWVWEGKERMGPWTVWEKVWWRLWE